MYFYVIVSSLYCLSAEVQKGSGTIIALLKFSLANSNTSVLRAILLADFTSGYWSDFPAAFKENFSCLLGIVDVFSLPLRGFEFGSVGLDLSSLEPESKIARKV